MTQPLYRKDIIFDRESGDYALYLDQELQGFARSYVEGEIVLDQLIHDLLIHDQLMGDATLDQRLAELAEQYADAKLRGETEKARQLKRIALELAAYKLGVPVAEFVAGYAAWKAVA